MKEKERESWRKVRASGLPLFIFKKSHNTWILFHSLECGFRCLRKTLSPFQLDDSLLFSLFYLNLESSSAVDRINIISSQ